MTKKTISVIATLLLLGGLSLYLNRGQFGSGPIQIGDRSLPPRDWMIRRFKNSPSNPVLFLLNRELRLTSVKVLVAAAVETNRYAVPIWNLTSDSNSIPVKEFIYGVNISGMKPTVKGAIADPLEPGVKYLLRIEAGPLKAEHDFTPVPKRAR